MLLSIYYGPYIFDGGLTAQSQDISFEGFSRLWLQQGGVGHGIWHGRDGALDPDADGTVCARFSITSMGTNGLSRTDNIVTDFEKYWLDRLSTDVNNMAILSKVDSKLFRRIICRSFG
jgi:hypothetical protein